MLQRIEILDASSLKRIFVLTTANISDDELALIEDKVSSSLINWENQKTTDKKSHIVGERAFHIIPNASKNFIFTLLTNIEDKIEEFDNLIVTLSSMIEKTDSGKNDSSSFSVLKQTVKEVITRTSQKTKLKTAKAQEEKKSLAVFKKKDKADQRSHFYFVGLGKVGKSSLYYQFFENWSIQDIENIKATIFRMHRQIDDEFIKSNILINDLGGQLQFRKQYLSDPTFFHNAAGIIFVVDCQDRNTIPTVEEYFKSVLEQVESDPSPHRPLMAIFVHKFDPAKRSDLEDNIFNYWFPMLQKLFRRLNPEYFLTSIYDHSARESMARFFLRSLPMSVMTRGISKEMILEAVKVLYPMINKLEPLVQDDVEESILEQDLIESAQEFGSASARRITKQWQEFLLHSDEEKTPEITNTLNLQLKVEPTGHFEVEFQCPIPKEQWVPELCAITHGLWSGLGKQFGYFHIEMLQTMIRDNTSTCRFSISD